MITWPESLIHEMARRRCILFLGSGVSACSETATGKRPLGWKDFIQGAINLLSPGPLRDEIQTLLDAKNYTLSLQAAVSLINKADYQQYLNDNFYTPRFFAKEIHRIIRDIDSKIVITTNFDKIYETYCHSDGDQGYKVIRYYEDSLVDELRSDTYIIIKAHGCIDNISSMIFTKSQYHEAKQKYNNFYEVLKSLFITNTILFIGCGMSDPDILLLLEDVKIVGKNLKPHYLLTIKDQSPFVKQDLLNTYNVESLEYGPTHDDLTQELQLFLTAVQEKRISLGIPF